MAFTLSSLISLLAIAQNALDPQIVGGRKAEPGEIPYQVSLQTYTGHHFCGGIILNQNYILTAAHCMSNKDVDRISATVGTTDLREPYAVYTIESSYVHEAYNRSNSWINDIALLKLKTPFVFSNLVSPVVLPKQNQTVQTDSVAVVSGYGRLWEEGSRTDELNVANIQIADQEYCRNIYKQHNIYDVAHICAYEPSEEKGACSGDSGGPLTVDGKLIGIVSWSHNCADTIYPTVYTRVPSYINWIKEHAV